MQWSYFKPPEERYGTEYNLNNSEDNLSCYEMPIKPTASSNTFSKSYYIV